MEREKEYLPVFSTRFGIGDWQVISKAKKWKPIRRHLEREEAVELSEKLSNGEIDPSKLPKEFAHPV